MDIAAADERGVYRIFGLPAGQYLVYVQASVAALDPQEVKRATSDSRTLVPPNVYYPSTPDSERAERVTVAAGEERAGIDIQVQYVSTATVKGFVSGGNGAPGGV